MARHVEMWANRETTRVLQEKKIQYNHERGKKKKKMRYISWLDVTHGDVSK